MYVYVQGWRLTRRTTPRTPRAGRESIVQRTASVKGIDELISKSLELCEDTERNLHRLQFRALGVLEDHPETSLPSRKPSARTPSTALFGNASATLSCP